MSVENLPGQPGGAPAAPAPGPTVAPAAPTPPAAPAAPAPSPAPVAPAGTELAAPPAAAPPATDNAVLGLAYKFFAKNGVGADAFKAAESGDFSKVKEALKGNADAAEYISAAESAHKGAQAAVAAKQGAISAICEGVAGGKDQWTAARDWAAKEATDAQRAELNAAMRAGGLQAKLAAQFIVGQYSKYAAGKAPVVAANAGGNPQSNATALSPAEFQREVAALTQSKGARFVFDTAEYKALEQRRMAYRGR